MNTKPDITNGLVRNVVMVTTAAIFGLFCSGSAVHADSTTRCVSIELYVKNDNRDCKKAEETLKEFARKKPGVKVSVYNMDESEKYAARFQQILKYFRLKDAKVPVVYCSRYFLANAKDATQLQQQVEAALTINVFVRAGCPHCAAAKKFLAKIKPRYPGYTFAYYDIVADAKALERMQQLAKRYQTAAASLPAIHICNSLSIGYIDDATTGRRLQSTLEYWTVPCPEKKKDDKAQSQYNGGSPSRLDAKAAFDESFVVVLGSEGDDPKTTGSATPPVLPPDSPLPPDVGPIAPGPAPDGDLPPAPLGPDGKPTSDGRERSPPDEDSHDTMSVPVFGELSMSQLGMPAFTFLIGLIDGFNPCAMWVLLFLLSVLVNLKSRAKMLAVAGTFVVISGVAYFAFMAAWLNIFLLVGYLYWVQVTLGVLGVVIGVVHIKDFFAFKKGISFSIPESAKPGIYARVRGIVTAQNLFAAIIGAVVLAVLVNIIELLCTAGLPALYTQILTRQGYPAWKNYAYLGLYNVAYMFDDSLMVGLVVITLDRHKLQERGGRWLKLISGIAIAVLGILMIVKPDWLV